MLCFLVVETEARVATLEYLPMSGVVPSGRTCIRKIGMQVATELDLSECGLEDEDVVELMDLMHSCPLLTSLNMRYIATHEKIAICI